MAAVSQNEEHHYLTFPRPVLEERAGGVDTVMLDLARSEIGLRTTIFSADVQDAHYEKVAIRAAAPHNPDSPLPFTDWFELGDWQLMHPDGHTSVTVCKEVLEEMYAASSDSPHPVGGFERLLDHLDRFAPNPSGRGFFNDRFNDLIGNVKPGATVNWQDFFFLPAVAKHADALRANGCFQTFHWHSALPDSLHRSDWGRSALEAMSKVDMVFVHTETYLSRLANQLDALALPVPALRRFDLGVDRNNLLEHAVQVTAQNYTHLIPDFTKLTHHQRDLIEAVFDSQGRIPHRFMCCDRADPNKGLHNVLLGIEKFLHEELKRLGSIEELRANYRFFGLHDLIEMHKKDRTHLKSAYVRKVREKYEELVTKFPGIVFYSGALVGPQRLAVPALMWGCHGVTGGAQDGLNLAIMENAVVNKDLDTAIIAGSGAGFAMQAIHNGNGASGYFPDPSNPESFRDAFFEVSRVKTNSPGALYKQKEALLRYEVYPRHATMAVSRNG